MKRFLALLLCLACLLCCGCNDEPHKDRNSKKENDSSDHTDTGKPQPTIVAGSLDIRLYKGFGTDGSEINNATVLFDTEGTWEPGVYSYENVTVSNAGNLPLAFTLRFVYDKATATESGNTLADVLKVAVIPGGITPDSPFSPDPAIQWQTLSEFAETGELSPGEAVVYAIVVSWVPTGNDGDYQAAGGLSIHLSLDLTAAQHTSESEDADDKTDTPVITAEEYTREIIKEADAGTFLTHHSIRCPALTHPGSDAQAINADISQNCLSAIEKLKAYEEGEYIYLYDYFYTDYNGIIGLILQYDIGLHYGGLYGVVEEYFFDNNTGKRLTFAEYAKVLGLTPEQVCQAMDASGEMGFLSSYTLEWFVADENRTYVYVFSPDAFDDYAAWQPETSLLAP